MKELLPYLTLGISVFALMISACGFWFQYVYRSDQVTCTVIKHEAHRSSGHCSCTLHLALGNSGTRSIMLTEAKLCLSHRHGSSTVSISGGCGTNYELPYLIEKGRILTLLTSQMLQDHTLQMFQTSYLPNNEKAKLGPFEFHLSLGFVTVSGEEMRYSESVLKLTVKPNDSHECEASCSKVRPWRMTVRRFWDDLEVI